MGKDLDRLAAEHDREDAVATVRGRDNQIAAFRFSVSMRAQQGSCLTGTVSHAMPSP